MSRPRWLCTALMTVLVVLLSPPARAAAAATPLCRTPAPASAAAVPREVHTGAWSYFGDPRTIAHGARVFTGCVGTDRGIVVEQYDVRSGKALHVHVHRNRELDDHDNPSLVLWRDRVYAFFAPHSGRVFPLDRHSEMRYRASKAPFSLSRGFGPMRRVATNTPGGLGYTYPNPVVAGDKLWLFWRGGDWEPTFSYTRDGVHWVKARTLVRGPNRQRPYAKYVSGNDGSIHMVFSEGHPRSYRTSLYYVRYRAGHFYRADGRPVGTLADLPLRANRLDRIYHFTEEVGRAWPHDIALDGNERPVVAYTGRAGGPAGDDTFYYARWDGTGWQSFPVVGAGPGAPTFTSGGITFDHAHPSRAVLSRTIAGWNEVELWRTPDGGATWSAPYAITRDSDAHNFRPVIPRGYNDASTLFVLYVHGTAESFRNFRTVIQMQIETPPARAAAAACGCGPPG